MNKGSGAALELILQSHTGELELLPVLPASWPSGKILGIRARGGFELDIEWSNRQLTRCAIRSSLGKTPVVRLNGRVIDISADRRFGVIPHSLGARESGSSYYALGMPAASPLSSWPKSVAYEDGYPTRRSLGLGRQGAGDS